MIWGIAWAVVSGMLALSTVAVVIYTVRLKIRRLSSGQINQLKQYGKSVSFWSFWGGVFGALGAAMLMRFTGVPRSEAIFWVIFSVTGGLIWGAFWGAFWQITSR